MKYAATAVLILFSRLLFAQSGYEIRVTLKPFKNQYIYLGHYYGRQLPIIDSVKLDANGTGTFKGPKKLGGGIYLIGYPDRSGFFEILIDKAQKFSIIADTSRIQSISFQGSPDNVDFKGYQSFMARHGRQLDSLNQAAKGLQGEDSAMLALQMADVNKKIRIYRNDIISKKPQSLLALLLKGMQEPEWNHTGDTANAQARFNWYKKHFWDGVEFYDDRWVRTPFFEGRVEKFLEQVVYPSADSVNREIDNMMGFASASEEMEKFLLLKFVNRYLNQKYMWEDAVFVHLFEKYFSNKNYPWLNERGKKMITDRAYSLMANITGTQAADIELNDTSGKKTSLHKLQSPYTVVAIWDPTCGHCKEVLPQMDSAYRASWKARGVKIFGMAKETDGKKSDWMNFIRENKLHDWTHVYYSRVEDTERIGAGIPSYSQLYDVQSFPTLYLLDKDKRIIAKKVTVQQIDEILSYREKNQ